MPGDLWRWCDPLFVCAGAGAAFAARCAQQVLVRQGCAGAGAGAPAGFAFLLGVLASGAGAVCWCSAGAGAGAGLDRRFLGPWGVLVLVRLLLLLLLLLLTLDQHFVWACGMLAQAAQVLVPGSLID